MSARRTRVALPALLAVLVVGWQASAATAADSVYWSALGAGAIHVGNLNGTGSAQDLFASGSGPQGVAIDAAAGKIYWADYAGGTAGAGKIEVANLNGTGAAQDLFTGETAPYGLAIDPLAGKIYWSTNVAAGAIRVANLNATGTPSDLFPGEFFPTGVAIDPAAGKIYWASSKNGGTIRAADLNGTGAQDLITGESFPNAVAIDSAAGKIYWTSQGAIRVGNVNGTGSPSTLFTGENEPIGLAVDPTAGKIYWADYLAGTIVVANLNGSGSLHDLFTAENHPTYPALLRAPSGVGVPQIFGGTAPGSMLSCSGGSWASDLLGSFLYRGPRSFAYQWSLNDSDIAGANSSTYTASTTGSYTCRVTATNQAGSTTQTSAPQVVAPQPPEFSSVRQSHRFWRRGTKLAVITKHKPPIGTTFSFNINQPAAVIFAFTQRLPGRRVNGRCVAPTFSNRHQRACTRTVARGMLSFDAHAGTNQVAFQGRVSAMSNLRPGRYRLIITATNTAGQQSTAQLTFTIASG